MDIKNEVNLNYSESETVGTYYLEIDAFDMRYVFFCPTCGLNWKTTDWYNPDKQPDSTFFRCYTERGGCGFEGVVYFTRGKMDG